MNLENENMNSSEFPPAIPVVNSLINPIIYAARVRQFRVAFLQILLRKSYTEGRTGGGGGVSGTIHGRKK